MSDEIYKIVLNKKEKIKKLWRETSKSSGQKIDGKCLLSLLEFLEDIINKKDEKFLNAKMERILSGCYFSDFTGNLSFFNDIILGKDVICKIVGQTLLFESKNLDELFTFSKRFDETLIRAFDYYYDKNSAVVIQRKKVFEEAADFLKSAVNFTKIGLFILDKNMRIIYWGEGIARMYDIEEKEVLNQQVLDVFPALKDEGIFQKMLNVLNSGEPGELLSQAHQTLKKGKRFIDFKISPLKDSEKNIIGVNVLLNDVTELKKDQQSLLEYEQFISNIFEDAAEAIFVLDENDCVKMWNKQATKMYGYSSDQIFGKHISLIVPNDEESKKEIEQINDIVKKNGFVRNWETERITVDGRRLQLRLTRTAIRDEEGKYLGSSVIAYDITEQKRLEQQLIHSEKLSAVGQLAAGIAHEVGSPLTAISSLAQLLYEKSEDDWDKDKLKIIREQIERISRIVRELVNFSKPISTSVGEVSVNKVIEEAAQIVKYDKRLKFFKFSMDLFPHLPLIKISFDQLLQVLINILLNAGDALEGREKGKISVTSRLVGEKIIVSIIDTGVGIEKENLDHIFEPFYTTKKPGKGTGLGLWVCYNIVRGFSGEIIVESEIDQGTAFHIVLPVIIKLDEKING